MDLAKLGAQGMRGSSVVGLEFSGKGMPLVVHLPKYGIISTTSTCLVRIGKRDKIDKVCFLLQSLSL